MNVHPIHPDHGAARSDRPRIFASLEDAAACARCWMTTLRLCHWDVSVEWFRETDRDELGRNHFTADRLMSSIGLLHPDIARGMIDPVDHECVLVHELLHLHFSGVLVWADEVAGGKARAIEMCVCVEQPVEALAVSLVWLRRRGVALFEAQVRVLRSWMFEGE